MASDAFSLAVMSRVEDAGLNASAPPQQRWLDGWLLRYLPGKARRARCINALAPGLLPLADKLALAEPVFAEAGLPMIFRLTRFTQPPGLDDELQRLGFALVDPTLVMIRPDLADLAATVNGAREAWGEGGDLVGSRPRLFSCKGPVLGSVAALISTRGSGRRSERCKLASTPR